MYTTDQFECVKEMVTDLQRGAKHIDPVKFFTVLPLLNFEKWVREYESLPEDIVNNPMYWQLIKVIITNMKTGIFSPSPDAILSLYNDTKGETDLTLPSIVTIVKEVTRDLNDIHSKVGSQVNHEFTNSSILQYWRLNENAPTNMVMSAFYMISLFEG